MNKRAARGAALFLGLVSMAGTLLAQGSVRTPEASPEAGTSQTFGVTDVVVKYHRPAVRQRRVWGGVVPYGILWRAGANENTTISFSTPVSIEGHALPAGTYSLFLQPAEQGAWTLIINHFAGGWGTYTYEQADDVLRVPVTPEPAEMQERLQYTFDEPTAKSVVLALRWEKLCIPMHITADTPALTMASLRAELRSGKHWDSQAYTQAADYALQQGELDTAETWINRAMQLSPDASVLDEKASIAEKRGDAKTAKEMRERSRAIGPEYTALSPAFALLQEKKYDEALAIVNAFIAAHPQAWNGWSALGFVYGEKGDEAKSHEAFDKAIALAPSYVERVEVQDSINALAAKKKS